MVKLINKKNAKTKKRGSHKKRSYSLQFKTKVALEVIKGEKILSEIASEYEIHPHQIKKMV